MKKLYNLCKQYGIEITMTYDTYCAYGDSVLFKFYDRKTNKYFCQMVTDEMMNAADVSFEDYLCEKVIKELKLDKDLCTSLRTCEHCKGSGLVSDYDPDHRSIEYSVCPDCNVEGKVKIGYR